MKELMNSNYVWVWNWFKNFKFILHQCYMVLVCMDFWFFYNLDGACFICLFMSSFSHLTKAAIANYSPYFIPILNIFNSFESFKIFKTQNSGTHILTRIQIPLLLNNSIINFIIIAQILNQPIHSRIILKKFQHPKFLPCRLGLLPKCIACTQSTLIPSCCTYV